MKFNIQKITYNNSNEYAFCYGEQNNENESQTKQFTTDIIKYFERKNYNNISEGELKNNQNREPLSEGLRFEWDGFEWIQKDEFY